MTRHRDSGDCLCALAGDPVLAACPSCAHTRPHDRIRCWDDQRLWVLNTAHLDRE